MTGLMAPALANASDHGRGLVDPSADLKIGSMPKLAYRYPFPRPAVAVDLVIVRPVIDGADEILLVQRRSEPYRGWWALPGGFIEEDETLEQAATRELEEETGVELAVCDVVQLQAYSHPDRDPRTRVISVAFFAPVPPDTRAVAGDDAAETDWFCLDKLPNLAFDHAQIIGDYLHRSFGGNESQR